MSRLIRFNKPFRVLTQFTRDGDKACLADFIDLPSVYPAGRLDYDSEGLLLLTDDGPLAHRLTDPRHKLPKTYLVQVEGALDASAIERLETGVTLKDGPTKPAQARLRGEPDWLWPRDPPVRYRASIPTSWLELQITEGRNRQVRRMCAAIGFPCLRLIRTRIGDIDLSDLEPGAWRELPPEALPHSNKRRPCRRRSS